MVAAEYVVFTCCWTIFLLYWAIKARSVKPTQEKRSMGAVWRATIVIIVGFLFFEGFRLPLAIYPLNISLTSHSGVLRVIGVVFTIVGFLVSFFARRMLAGNWSASDKAVIKERHELITTRLYSCVRHPIYSGFLLAFLGNVLFAGTVSAFLLFVFALLSLWVSLRREEKLPTEHFPIEYPAYKKRVKALIPFVW
jgi:protein-S-isoprenylcysteine O-methyltransferase Ste14